MNRVDYMKYRFLVIILSIIACLLICIYAGYVLYVKRTYLKSEMSHWRAPMLNRMYGAKFKVQRTNSKSLKFYSYQSGSESAFPDSTAIDWEKKAYAAVHLPDIFLGNSFWNNPINHNFEYFECSASIPLLIQDSIISHYAQANEYKILVDSYVNITSSVIIYKYSLVSISNTNQESIELYPCSLKRVKSVYTYSGLSDTEGEILSESNLDRCNFILIPTDSYCVFDTQMKSFDITCKLQSYYIINLNYI
jgi:hypothetical protein